MMRLAQLAKRRVIPLALGLLFHLISTPGFLMQHHGFLRFYEPGEPVRSNRAVISAVAVPRNGSKRSNLGPACDTALTRSDADH